MINGFAVISPTRHREAAVSYVLVISWGHIHAGSLHAKVPLPPSHLRVTALEAPELGGRPRRSTSGHLIGPYFDLAPSPDRSDGATSTVASPSISSSSPSSDFLASPDFPPFLAEPALLPAELSSFGPAGGSMSGRITV